jgi:murein DD-endopeptidase MepM/ murein hydrolase activator NlpD
MSDFSWPLAENLIRGSSLADKKKNLFGDHVGRYAKIEGKLVPRCHQGWDFSALTGTPCYSIADGKVVHALPKCGDFGDLLIIELARTVVPYQKLYAAYAHLQQFQVKVGDRVRQDQCVGRTGDTGNARGMPAREQHLHFEIRTHPRPGKGIVGRLDPIRVFGTCPLLQSVRDPKHTVLGLDSLFDPVSTSPVR